LEGASASACKVVVSKVGQWVGYIQNLWKWTAQPKIMSNQISVTWSSTFRKQPTHLPTGLFSAVKMEIENSFHTTWHQHPETRIQKYEKSVQSNKQISERILAYRIVDKEQE
jgi:hypothetical protein